LGQFDGYVFEAYGTLFDSGGKTSSACESFFPGRGRDIAKIWYKKTLQYTWICSLMERKADFKEVISRALETSLRTWDLQWSFDDFFKIVDSFTELEAFQDVQDTLIELTKLKKPFTIVSDGSRSMLLQLINNTKLSEFSEDAKEEMVISAEEVGVFKPNKAVYQAAQKKMAKISPDKLAYVTSSLWDVAGARAAGFKNVVFLQRPSAHKCFDVYDKELAPCCTILSLCDLISNQANQANPLAEKMIQPEAKKSEMQAGSNPDMPDTAVLIQYGGIYMTN